MTLNQDEILRYARHFSVKSIGIEGQQKIKSCSVLLVGAGGIGSPAALYLASCGVGKLGIVDDDTVELSNLQRQILYTTKNLGQKKAEAAATHLEKLNPNVDVEVIPVRLDTNNAASILRHYDLVIDGSDNYPTRYLVNDICVSLGIPLISASIFQFSGQLGLYNFDKSACYRCLYPEAPPEGLIPNCAAAGVLGVLPGILATMAVNEALKWMIGFEVKPGIIQFDGMNSETKRFETAKNPECPICSGQQDYKSLNSTNHAQGDTMAVDELTTEQLATWLREDKAFNLIDVRQDWERALCAIEPSQHIPLDQVPTRINEIDASKPTVIYCKAGARSYTACQYLLEHNYQNVYNVPGGILKWKQDQAPQMLRY